MESFKCLNCGKIVQEDSLIGTSQRNHCPFCLYSRHLDLEIAGDRGSGCKALMGPVGLTFKQEGIDKYGKEKQGEIMLIHKCVECGKISINRIAGDDDVKEILRIFAKTINMDSELKEDLEKRNINPLKEKDEDELKKQLFGRN